MYKFILHEVHSIVSRKLVLKYIGQNSKMLKVVGYFIWYDTIKYSTK